MKKIGLLMILGLTILVVGACSNEEGDAASNAEDVITIGIIQTSEHPALDDGRDGFIRVIEAEGFNVEWDIQNGAGDATTLATIAQRFVNNEVDLVLAIGTPAVQAMAAQTSDIPIIGTAITTYTGAGVVESHEAPRTNVTGASNLMPTYRQVELVLEFAPDIERVGILYTSGAINSEVQAIAMREHLAMLGIEYDVLTITNVNDLQQVATTLAGRNDVILTPSDNIIATALPLIENISLETGTLLFMSETNMTLGGGIATVSISHYELGAQSAHMAARVLRGEADPATMPVEYQTEVGYIVNGHMVRAHGLTVPERLLPYVQYPEEN